MQRPTIQSAKPSDDYIASVTYSFWERAGCPQGQEMEFWQEAEHYIVSVRNAECRKSGGKVVHHRVK